MSDIDQMRMSLGLPKIEPIKHGQHQRDTTSVDAELKPCPACPDGYVWNSDGQTGRVCQVCKGYAVVHLNGSPLTKAEAGARTHD